MLLIPLTSPTAELLERSCTSWWWLRCFPSLEHGHLLFLMTVVCILESVTPIASSMLMLLLVCAWSITSSTCSWNQSWWVRQCSHHSEQVSGIYRTMLPMLESWALWLFLIGSGSPKNYDSDAVNVVSKRSMPQSLSRHPMSISDSFFKERRRAGDLGGHVDF
jgi:hypothetical protein